MTGLMEPGCQATVSSAAAAGLVACAPPESPRQGLTRLLGLAVDQADWLDVLDDAEQTDLYGALTNPGEATPRAVGLLAKVLAHSHGEETFRKIINFIWFYSGTTPLELGFVLDSLSALMLIVVSLVGLIIFIFSIGYMDEDENAARFFTFLSLFAGSMLGLVIANSLLLLFVFLV